LAGGSHGSQLDLDLDRYRGGAETSLFFLFAADFDEPSVDRPFGAAINWLTRTIILLILRCPLLANADIRIESLR
jgi:hypothetical protein